MEFLKCIWSGFWERDGWGKMESSGFPLGWERDGSIWWSPYVNGICHNRGGHSRTGSDFRGPVSLWVHSLKLRGECGRRESYFTILTDLMKKSYRRGKDWAIFTVSLHYAGACLEKYGNIDFGWLKIFVHVYALIWYVFCVLCWL